MLSDPNYTYPNNYNQLNDSAIADAFLKWLPTAPTLNKWFTAVSFVNPHDISQFPFAFGLTGSDPTDFGPPSNTYKPAAGFQPPPTNSDPLTPYGGRTPGEWL